MTDDHSPGDARKPYADIGGPEARHAQTHDVRREAHTNPKGPEPVDTSFAGQMALEETGDPGGHAAESVAASEDKVLHVRLQHVSAAELSRLSVLDTGTRLEQGGTYVDLNRLDDGPFKAVAGHETTDGERLVAKRDTDYLLWNKIVGQDAAVDLERPERAEEQE